MSYREMQKKKINQMKKIPLRFKSRRNNKENFDTAIVFSAWKNPRNDSFFQFQSRERDYGKIRKARFTNKFIQC